MKRFTANPSVSADLIRRESKHLGCLDVSGGRAERRGLERDGSPNPWPGLHRQKLHSPISW